VRKLGQQEDRLNKHHDAILSLQKEVRTLEDRVAEAERRLTNLEGRPATDPLLSQLEDTCHALISHALGRDPGLEAQLRQKMGRRPFIHHDKQPKEPEVYVSLSRRIGPVAARVFESCAVKAETAEPGVGMAIGLSGGRTVRAMAEAVQGEYGRGLWLLPLTAPRRVGHPSNSVNAIIARFCSQPGSLEVRGQQVPLDWRARQVMSDSAYHRIFGKVMESFYQTSSEDDAPPPVTYVFAGLGSRDRTSGYSILADELGMAWPDDAIGDFLGWPISAEGKVLTTPDITKAAIGVRPDYLQRDGRQYGKLRKVVALAASRGVTITKEQAVLAAWRGGLLDVLVTDVQTAKRLLQVH
jgi:DNA-binding transcriptional regulator LsrR (DeoR family)